MYGIITTWVTKRGFGFVLPDGSNGDEIFVHFSDCPANQWLAVNTRIKFELGRFGGRIKAVNVAVVASPEVRS